MRLRAGLLAVMFTVISLNEAVSWGSSGHSIIAEIAQHRLHPAVIANVKGLLGGEVSLASIASWADSEAHQRPETTNWHFVNIPFDATSYEAARDCKATPKGDCIIGAIARLRATLGDRYAPKSRRAEALRFLVH